MNSMLFAKAILIVNQQLRLLQDAMSFVIKGFLPLRTTWILFDYKD
jgi:hypothetical protein